MPSGPACALEDRPSSCTVSHKVICAVFESAMLAVKLELESDGGVSIRGVPV